MPTPRHRWFAPLGFALASAMLIDAEPADASPTVERPTPHAESAAPTAPAAESARSTTSAAAMELLAEPVTYAPWRGLTKGCSYLAPPDAGAAPDGSIDVVFHFHAGQMATREMKESGRGTVFVSCGYGFGSGPYAAAFARPERFGEMLKTLVTSLEKTSGVRGLTIRHLGLASWSAGYGAVARILAVPRYYAMVESVVLNDSLHAGYVAGPKGVEKRPAQGVERVDVKMLRTFVRFANDAVAGKKTMVMTHSSIVPPDYASSTEATRALLAAVDVPVVELAPGAVTSSVAAARSMTPTYRADRGDLHAAGFRGRGKHDHIDHLHLLGEALDAWIVPRWRQHTPRVVGHATARR